MPTEPRTSERLARAAVALAALVAAATSWFASDLYGLGIDGDAAWMLSAGTSFAHGRGFVTCLDEPYSLWPPLHPLLVALFVRVAGDPLPALRVVQALALAATVVLAALLARRASGSSFAAVATSIALAASRRLHEYTVQVVSETVFLPLVLAALLCAALYVERRSRAWWVAALVAASLACLQRYLGVVVVAVISASFLFDPSRPLARRLVRATTFGVASVVPISLWLVRNYVVEGKWTGGRTAAKQPASDILAGAFATLRSWASFEALAPWTGWLGLAFCVAGLALLAHVERRRPTVLLAAAFAVAYFVVVVGASAVVRVDSVGDRLLLPLLPIGVALGWACAARVGAGGWSRAAAVALAVLVTCDSAVALRRYVALWRGEGAGSFHTRSWMEHPLTKKLSTLELHEPCYSNAPELVWLLRGARGRMLTSQRRSWQYALDEIRRSGRPATVLWFQQDSRPPGHFEVFGDALTAIDTSDAGRVELVAPR